MEHPRLRKTNLNYNVTVHYKEKTEEINRSIGKLSPLTGALAIHEISDIDKVDKVDNVDNVGTVNETM